MTDAVSQYQGLAKRLYSKTKEGKLHWAMDPWTEKLSTSLAGYKIQLERGETAEGEPIVSVSILGDANDFIDGFNDESLSGVDTGIEEVPSYWRLLDVLYTTAYRLAKGADKALEAIINDLDLDDDLPF